MGRDSVEGLAEEAKILNHEIHRAAEKHSMYFFKAIKVE
jgi:hypothetical protein